MLIKNETPFVIRPLVGLDKRGAEVLTLAMKATFEISEEGAVAVAEEQRPLALGDEFYGDPETTSIRVAAELAPMKPATDVFLRGSAVAQEDEATQVDVSFQVGPVHEIARVFGDRHWEKVVGVNRMSAPQPFERIPLTWERAFGGRDLSAKNEKHRDWLAANPVGCGYRSKQSQLGVEASKIPNVEDPDDLVSHRESKPGPVGFAPIARHWEPRVWYAGTYDKKWERRRFPLLPDDFDERFHNAAPPRLIAPGYLQGGEPVSVVGCTESGRLDFALPRIAATAEVRHLGGVEAASFSCETVIVDTDAMQLELIFKVEFEVHKKLTNISDVRCALVEA